MGVGGSAVLRYANHSMHSKPLPVIRIYCPSTSLQGNLSYGAQYKISNRQYFSMQHKRLKIHQTHTAYYYHSIEK